jgi:hypothetical protein
MKFCALLVLVGICAAQAAPMQIQEEHEHAIAENPKDVRLVIALVPSREGHNEELHLKLFFTSTTPHSYTAELAPGGNTAAIDDFIFQGPGMLLPVHSKDGPIPEGVVCCGSDRRYIGKTPISANAYFKIILPPRIPGLVAGSNFRLVPIEPPPGDYSIFVQTRRVMKGWPKSERDLYFKASDVVITSSNCVHVTVLPDGSVVGERSTP